MTDRRASDNYRHNLVRAVEAEERQSIGRSRRRRGNGEPLRKLKAPRTRPRDVYLMPEQWDRLVAGCRKVPRPAQPSEIITVMKETGCRPKEARTVEKRHFDRGGKCWVFPADESKGEREPRIVLLQQPGFRALRAARAQVSRRPALSQQPRPSLDSPVTRLSPLSPVKAPRLLRLPLCDSPHLLYRCHHSRCGHPDHCHVNGPR